LITDHNVTETLSICDRAYLLIEGKIFKQGTAEELAADEQVRKLYLGRNFELKRKDWLHEEARSEVGASLENLIVSVENALAWNEKIIQANTQSERSFGHQYISTAATIADLGLDDYSKFLLELKQYLIQYGKQNKNAEILERANKFLTDDGDINTDLNTILLFLKSEQQ
jgi:ABC-type multidrug transport system ATPase subunit